MYHPGKYTSSIKVFKIERLYTNITPVKYVHTHILIYIYTRFFCVQLVFYVVCRGNCEQIVRKSVLSHQKNNKLCSEYVIIQALHMMDL